MKTIPLFLLLSYLLMACGPAQSQSNAPAGPPKEFGGYWFQGQAELNSYTLQQGRYGEVHEGEAVLIFVTEDFSRRKQVKLDNPAQAGNDKVPILKLNATRKFLTGLYPYSIMQSVFSPLNLKSDPHALKTSTSVQEWCGHVYTQFNREKNGYQLTGHSYFESEGESEENVPLGWLEDELWNWIRIAPDHLPTGKQQVIPGSIYTRLTHRAIQAETAELSIEKEGAISRYRISYPKSGRELVIRFENAFPHKILGWEETYASWGRQLTTTAELKETLKTDYWTKNKNADRAMRSKLGLE